MKFSGKQSDRGRQGHSFSKGSDTKRIDGSEEVCSKCKKPGHYARGCWSGKFPNPNFEKKPKGQALVVQASLCLDESSSSTEIWYVDSEATDHMSNQKKWFINLSYFEKPHSVYVGKKGESVDALGIGEINILAYNGQTWEEKHLSRVLFVPDLRCNLF